MRKLLFLLFIGIAVSFSSCRKDFNFETSTGGLEFSKNVIYLDSVFTTISSSTYRLKVYNRSDKDISIPEIRLENESTINNTHSKYRIMVDGMTGEDVDGNGVGDGKVFKNVELLAKDSLFIFIETTSDIADINSVDFTYNDNILFYSSIGIQKVGLVTPIRDANFIFPNRDLPTGPKETLIINGEDSEIEGHKLTTPEELHWTNEKPYVVYGYAFVPDGATLTIDAGANVFFHANSGLILDKNAKIIVNGTDAEKVNFQGDRLETSFADTPGQWGVVLLTSGQDNLIDFLTIKNATVGLLVQRSEATTTPKLDITNSRIYNSSNVGLLARTSTVNGTNLVINGAGQAALACNYGGTYNFTHCTINNHWSSSKQVSVLLSNYIDVSSTEYATSPLIEANFTNCIIYGGNQVEMYLDKKSEDDFNYYFNHCLLRFNNVNNQFTNNDMYQFATDATHYNNCTIALTSTQYLPKFESIAENKMWINESIGLPADITTLGTIDIKGITRTDPIDLGAYQAP